MSKTNDWNFFHDQIKITVSYTLAFIRIHKDNYYDNKAMFSTGHIYKFHPIKTIKDYDKLLRITT